MRTVLYGIHLLIDNMIMHTKVYIWNLNGERARQQRDRERERERGINLIIGENINGRFESNQKNHDAANDVFPIIRIFCLVICKRHFIRPTSHKSCIHFKIVL